MVGRDEGGGREGVEGVRGLNKPVLFVEGSDSARGDDRGIRERRRKKYLSSASRQVCKIKYIGACPGITYIITLYAIAKL